MPQKTNPDDMKLPSKNPELVGRITLYFSVVIRLVLNALLLVLLAALLIGVFKSGYDVFSSLHESLQTILQRLLLDTVFIVALLEICITLLGYLKDGRVHVRYILDSVLIIMLNEVVALWFRHANLQQAIGIAVIIVALAVVRVTVTRFAPTDDNG